MCETLINTDETKQDGVRGLKNLTKKVTFMNKKLNENLGILQIVSTIIIVVVFYINMQNSIDKTHEVVMASNKNIEVLISEITKVKEELRLREREHAVFQKNSDNTNLILSDLVVVMGKLEYTMEYQTETLRIIIDKKL
jgi:hypothetical protein